MLSVLQERSSSRSEYAKGGEGPRPVGADLDAGAELLELVGLLENLHVMPAVKKRERRRHSADAGAGNQDAVLHAAAPLLGAPPGGPDRRGASVRLPTGSAPPTVIPALLAAGSSPSRVMGATILAAPKFPAQARQTEIVLEPKLPCEFGLCEFRPVYSGHQHG